MSNTQPPPSSPQPGTPAPGIYVPALGVQGPATPAFTTQLGHPGVAAPPGHAPATLASATPASATPAPATPAPAPGASQVQAPAALAEPAGSAPAGPAVMTDIMPRSAAPVPPASPPPFRPSRNPVVRLILWFTEPSMIKGIALGVVFALVISVAFRLEAMWFIASSVLTLIITCLFGVLIGNYIFENRRKKLQRRGVEMLARAGGELPGLSDDLLNLLWNRDRAALATVWERLRRVRPAAQEIAGLSIAALFRMMAMTTLFAVLGGAISFAVFLTSYMQVERMDAQNKLISTQIDQTAEQMKLAVLQQQVEVALSIAERRQVTTREILTVVNNDPKPLQDGKRVLTGATANLIAVAIAQLEPYLGVQVDRESGVNALSQQPRSPEQEQLIRYLSAANIDFSDLDLSRAFLDHADLHGTELARIQLRGVRMRHAALYDVKLAGADLAGADLAFALLARSDLGGSNLARAVLHKANLDDAVLVGANLAEADLSGAMLKKAVFKQTQLGRARLHGAVLSQTDLGGADITDADLALADLREATMPVVPRVRAAAYWWLAVYPPDYAVKLGLDAAALERNQAAIDRLRAAPDAAAMAAIVAELKAAAPNAPA